MGKISNHKFKNNLTINEREGLKWLKSSNLKIIKTDKNLGPAIMVKSQYIDWCEAHLGNNQFYESHEIQNETHLIEEQKMLVHNFITENDKFLKLAGMSSKERKIFTMNFESTNLPKFYGLAKIHKKGFPRTAPDIRPVVSYKNAPLTGISKWLAELLLPHLKKCSSFIKNYEEVIPLINETNQNNSDSKRISIFSLDAIALYTSIPLMNAISVMYNFINNESKWYLRIIMKRALKLIMNNTLFNFNNRIYKQKKGLPMGNPLAPIVASLYIAFFEPTTCDKYIYIRYVDDVLIIQKKRMTV